MRRERVLAKIKEMGGGQDAVGAYIGLLNEADAKWVLSHLDTAPEPEYPPADPEIDDLDYEDERGTPRGILG